MAGKVVGYKSQLSGEVKHYWLFEFQANAINIDNVSMEELIGIIDDTLACLVKSFDVCHFSESPLLI